MWTTALSREVVLMTSGGGQTRQKDFEENGQHFGAMHVEDEEDEEGT